MKNNLKNKKTVQPVIEKLDYHEGLSPNQVKIILKELGFGGLINEFNAWMYGQTCPIIIRSNEKTGKEEKIGGIYEYDLFRWIDSKETGSPAIFD